MKHKVSGQKLGRDTSGRKALLRNLASELVAKGAIITTLAKAKFARPYIEKLVTSAKINRLTKHRSLESRLTHQAFIRLQSEIGPGFRSRAGGYTRIIKLGIRKGDAAPLARLEFLQWEKTPTAKVQKSPRKTINRRKSAINLSRAPLVSEVELKSRNQRSSAKL
ncbi:50S ribosomal protein L17 [Candidatus Curtissbacteria bacterium]|nr:50S ribosomal protein L17 [Candidatus Curtissbacteria bacterium]